MYFYKILWNTDTEQNERASKAVYEYLVTLHEETAVKLYHTLEAFDVVYSKISDLEFYVLTNDVQALIVTTQNRLAYDHEDLSRQSFLAAQAGDVTKCQDLSVKLHANKKASEWLGEVVTRLQTLVKKSLRQLCELKKSAEMNEIKERNDKLVQEVAMLRCVIKQTREAISTSDFHSIVDQAYDKNKLLFKDYSYRTAAAFIMQE
jgi:site-specific DNA-adenine methylase